MASSVASVSYFLISGVLVALATYVWREKPRSPINSWFAIFSVMISAWVLGVGGLHTGSTLEFWGRFTFASACLIPPTFLAFITWYPDLEHPTGRQVSHVSLLTGGVLAVISLATPYLVHDVAITSEGLHRETGPLYSVFVAYFIATWVIAALVFRQKWMGSRSISRAQLQYLGAGILVSLAGAILVNLVLPFLTGRSTYSWLGPYFATLLVTLIGHAIIRHRLMDLRPVILRGLVYIVAVGGLYAASFTLLYLGYGSATHTITLPAHILLGAIILAVTALPSAQRILANVIEPYLYRGRVEYETALRDATHEFSHLMDPRALADKFRTILNSVFVPDFFVMSARSSTDEPFEELAVTGDHVSNPHDLIADLALALNGRVAPTVVVLQSPEQFAGHPLRTAGCEIAIALGRRDQLLGVVALGPRRSGDPYFARDIAFIESLAELASVALENAYLYRRQVELLEYSDRLLEALDSAVVVADVSGRLNSFNSAAIRLLGISRSAIGSRLEILPSEIGWALTFSLVQARAHREIEALIDHASGHLVPVMISSAPLHTQRDVAGAFVVVTDLSAVKALERNQRRMDRLTLMARFYAGLAHEIRTPLASISTFISMLPDRYDDIEYRDTAARLLPLEVNRIVQLADRLRFMAPSEGAKLHPVNLSTVLQDMVTLQAPRATDSGIVINLNSQPSLPLIYGDPNQLTQLFLNLLKNAMEAMPTGGTITIDTRRISMSQTRGEVRVRIIDEGTGFDSRMSSRLFEPFFTTKPHGTGLGLSICREIADFHNARLSVVARVDGHSGSIAEIVFPAEDTESIDPQSLQTSAVR